MTSQPSTPLPQGFENVSAQDVFRELFERAAIGMTLVELATRRFVWANAKLCEMTQYSREELLQRTAVDLTHPEDRPADKTSFDRFVRGDVDRRVIEKRYVQRSGESIWVRITTSVVDLAGRKYLFGITEDINERRRAQEALHNALADAEQAQLALREADKRKDEFLAMLAHELRNPLASIRNSAAIMQALPLADPTLTDVERVIERQSRHLARLVDDLLDVARISTGKVRLRRDNLSLLEVVRRAIDGARPLIESRRHDLTVELAPEDLRVMGDEVRLAQIIDNLLNNAAKYTPPGGRITVSAERRGHDAVIRVSDSGVGISPELIPQIFEMFEQANTSLARTEGGLGIGLTITKSLVEMHGGEIRVTSERARGSTFEVVLPAVSKPADEHVPSPDRDVGVPPMRILLVEDNEDAAETLAMLLRLSGHDVRTAGDGFTALRVSRDFRADALLIDIGLPGMDGYELARACRRETATSDALLVAVSGYGDAADRVKSTEAGFDYHLVKPIDYATLQRILHTKELH